MLNSILSNTTVWLLVFARMGGLIGMNPLFSRRNVPSMVRMGLIFLLTLLVAPGLSAPELAGWNSLDLFVGLLRELFVGLACGFVFQIYYYMLFFTGDLMDMQFGLSMAKVFDPGTNIQMSISSNLLNIVFALFIFATNSHLLLIQVFTASFQILPLGGASFSPECAQFFLELFIGAFSLGLRLALPFMAAEFVLELSMGVLMKLIPQIHVFVINIQFKLLLGILLLLAFANPIATFTDHYMRLMLENLQRAFMALGS